MLNQCVLAGRIFEIDGNVLKIATTRYYKNENGEYDTDIISCKISENIAKQAKEFCKKGDFIGIKARIETEDENIIIIAEKLTLLNSKQEDGEK